MAAGTAVLDWHKISAYAAKMGPKSDYPTVVIGAGLGGLVCGAYLARQGIPVTVVEQHSVPGGYATSFERAAGKFNFEVSLHGTSIDNNGAARILSDIGVLDKLQLVELPEVYRLKTSRLDISIPQKNPEAYVALLSGHFPGEAEGIRGFVSELLAISDEVDTLSRKKGKLFKLIFPLQYPKMWNIRNKTLADLLNDHVKDPDLKAVLSALWGTMDYRRHGSPVSFTPTPPESISKTAPTTLRNGPRISAMPSRKRSRITAAGYCMTIGCKRC